MLSAIAGLLLAIRVTYASPVDYDVTLAGNFGEPRLNHFHCGIDVKTDGVEGKRLMAVADGYVSRITVGLSGFGNALYITHPDGNTSVYCHLKSFTPAITRLLRKWQYAHKSYVADVRLGPLACPVARGQFVAVSGNTGASEAPHLHLEMHDTRTGRLRDPLDVLGNCVADGMAPMAHAFMAYPVAGEGIFEGGSAKRSFGFGSHKLARRFTAWGKVGFGIWANDYTEATYNRYGVRETVLRVDGREVFRSCVDGIPPFANRRINYWGDYEHYLRYGVWYMKSFRTPGNTLPFITTDSNGGIVDFNEERDYTVEYSLTDYYGNTSVYSFVVSGVKAQLGHKKEPANGKKMKHNEISTYSYPGVWLVIPKGILDGNIMLRPIEIKREDPNMSMYSFYDSACPLASWAELGLAVQARGIDPSKLYVRSGDGRYFGGTYKNGWVTARIRELGVAYGLAYDDRPPTVVKVGRDGWGNNNRLQFNVTDGESGVKSVKGYIDNEFILFEHVDKSSRYVCSLTETPVKKTGRLRTLTFVVTDNRNNKTVVRDALVY